MKINFTNFPKRRRALLLSMLSLLVLYSCVNRDDFEFDKIAGVEWSGNYALPILNTSLTLNDLLPKVDSNYVKSDEEGLIYFEYKEKVHSYDIRDAFQIRPKPLSKEYELPEIKLPSFSNTLNLTARDLTGRANSVTPFAAIVAFTPTPNSFNFPAFNDLEYVKFSQGTLEFEVTNNAKAALTFNVALSNSDGTAIGTFAFSVPGNGGVHKLTRPLVGVTIRKQIRAVITSVASPGSAGAYNPQDVIKFSTSITSDAKASEGEIILQEDVKITANEPVVLDFFEGEQLKEILLKGGYFNYSINSGINYPSEASLSFPTMESNGTIFKKTFPIGAQSSASASNLSLANYKTDLATLNPAYNRFPLQIEVVCKKSTNTFKWKSTDKVSVDVSMVDLEFKYLKGFFGNKQIPLERNTFEIGLFDNTLNGYDVSLNNINIFFNVFNDYGVPVRLDFSELRGSGSDKDIDILTTPGSPFDMLYPADFLQKAGQTKLEITNALEVYKINPSLISYQLDATLNHGVGSGQNFLTDTSKVTVEMNANIPLWGRAGNIILEDTVDNSLEGDIEDAQVQFIKLRAFIENGFPLDAKVQIYFADKNYTITDSLFTPEQSAFIRSSEVNANGESIKSGLYDQTVEVNQLKFERLIKSPYLIIKGKLSTTDSGKKDVKIKTNYKLDVKLGLQTKLNVKVRL